MNNLIKNGLLLLFMFQLQFSFAQDKKIADLTKADFITDFNLGMNILKKHHPNPYKLTDSGSFNRHIDSLRRVLEQDPTFVTFLRVMAENPIEDVQTTFAPSEKLLKEWIRTETFFPYPVMMKNNKTFVNIVGEQIPLGSEILSINGLSSEKFSTRGATNFQQFFGLFYPQKKKSYDLTYIKPGSSDTSFITVPALKIEAALHRKKMSYFPLNALQLMSPIYQDFNDQEKTGILTLSSSPQGQNEVDQKFGLFFKEVKKRKYKNVIIDLRESKGAPIAIAEKLYSFIAPGTFKNQHNGRLKSLDMPFQNEMLDDNQRKYAEEDLNNRKNVYAKNFDKDSSGFYVGNESIRETLKDYPADKDAFHGNVYVLTSRKTLIGASYFCLLVQRNKRGHIIGEETGSGAYSCSALSTETFHLLKTSSNLNIPPAELYFFETNSDDCKGVLPDLKISTERFKRYILAHKDPELTYAFELIRHSAK